MCPSCDERIQISGQPEIGLMVTCPSCGDLLEIIQLDPVELDWIYYQEENDWDDNRY
jgi:lysine biosynthesis protein LysW